MMSYKCTKEQIQFILDKAKNKIPSAKIAGLLYVQFDKTISSRQIRNIINKSGISGYSCQKITKEQIQFIKKHIKGKTVKELTVCFNNFFNTSFSDTQIRGFIKTWGIKLGLPCRQRSPIGTELNCKVKGGYIYVKVAHGLGAKGNYKLKHTYIYEQAFGPVPKEYCVIFLDQNHSNYSLDNLGLVLRRELSQLNKQRLIFNDKELTKTGIAIIRHKEAITNRMKQGETAL